MPRSSTTLRQRADAERVEWRQVFARRGLTDGATVRGAAAVSRATSAQRIDSRRIRNLHPADSVSPRLARPQDRDDAAAFSELCFCPDCSAHAARYSPGVISLIMDGEKPAREPDAVIDELKGRERDGIIVSAGTLL